MKLDFRLLKLKEDSRYLATLKGVHSIATAINDNLSDKPFIEFRNEFIAIKENDGNYEVHQLCEKGLGIIGGNKLDSLTIKIPKEEFLWDGATCTRIDIPKDLLTLDLVEEVLNTNAQVVENKNETKES